MDTKAYLKGTRLSPQKAGLVANAIRGKSIQEAMDFLDFNKQKGSSVIKKLPDTDILVTSDLKGGTMCFSEAGNIHRSPVFGITP